MKILQLRMRHLKMALPMFSVEVNLCKVGVKCLNMEKKAGCQLLTRVSLILSVSIDVSRGT